MASLAVPAVRGRSSLLTAVLTTGLFLGALAGRAGAAPVPGAVPEFICVAAVDPLVGTENVTTFTFYGGASGAPPFLWLWDFGGGANATTQNASHVYASAGTYTAHLTVTNATRETCAIDTVAVTVGHLGPLSLTVSLPTDAVDEGAWFNPEVLAVTDAAGHDLLSAATVSWTVSPSSCGFFTPVVGAITRFVANTNAGGLDCALTATATADSLVGTWTRPLLVRHAWPFTVQIQPSFQTVGEGSPVQLAAAVTDAVGHNLTTGLSITWTVSPTDCGTFSRTNGTTTEFTPAAGKGGTTCYIRATLDSRAGSAEGLGAIGVESFLAPYLVPIAVLVLVVAILVGGAALVLLRRRPKARRAFKDLTPLPPEREMPVSPTRRPPFPPPGGTRPPPGG